MWRCWGPAVWKGKYRYGSKGNSALKKSMWGHFMILEACDELGCVCLCVCVGFKGPDLEL